ncbi:Gfo/Idh/MocA family oxidoreductase [Ramlibacter tataouinensis]|uniref:Gfo/Idh/MocA family protein n=1 Tax=Ramlibacter tataouinensis TaxID=94132 RepID=UPI0022F3DA7B|nr:Gfo/Idh/MocA family oxidoreductase [Ramlibacter tataouinensis]WBY00703.1 Gfo/Idh/MocA family oxidoreductase [Ramlibacter tataouinensis]
MKNAIQGRKVRFAIVGCGRIAKNHIGSIRQHGDDAELVGVCDIDPAALQAAVKETGAKGYDHIEALLADTNADVIVLTTPSGIHPAHAILCAKAGFHVLSEKPMATRWEDGLRMVRACDEAGVRLFVVKQNRRNATLQLLKQAVEAKRFGRIYMVTLNVFWQRPQQGYYDQAKWRGTWELDGGAFMNQASHYVDLLEWLIGPIESLHAYTGTLARDIEAEDTGVLSCKWRSGAMGSLNVTMLTYPKNLEGSITILGEKGTVRVGGVAVNEIQHWEFEDKRPEDESVKAASYETTSVYGFGHPLYYRNVIDVMRGQAEPEVDGREGLKSLEVLVAAYRSARDGVRVSLPLEL